MSISAAKIHIYIYSAIQIYRVNSLMLFLCEFQICSKYYNVWLTSSKANCKACWGQGYSAATRVWANSWDSEGPPKVLFKKSENFHWRARATYLSTNVVDAHAMRMANPGCGPMVSLNNLFSPELRHRIRMSCQVQLSALAGSPPTGHSQLSLGMDMWYLHVDIYSELLSLCDIHQMWVFEYSPFSLGLEHMLAIQLTLLGFLALGVMVRSIAPQVLHSGHRRALVASQTILQYKGLFLLLAPRWIGLQVFDRNDICWYFGFNTVSIMFLRIKSKTCFCIHRRLGWPEGPDCCCWRKSCTGRQTSLTTASPGWSTSFLGSTGLWT